MAENQLENFNSAERLLSVLQAVGKRGTYLKSLPAAIGYTSPTHGGALEQQRVCLTCLIELNELYEQFKSDLRRSSLNEEQAQEILRGLKGLGPLICPRNMESSIKPLGQAEVSLLRVAATIIPREESLSADDIAKIRQSIGDLQEQVERCAISPELRKVLLELIRLSQDAISGYQIHGAKALRRAFKHMLGEVAEAYSHADDTSPGDASAWKAIQKHLHVFDTVATKVRTYAPMLKCAVRLLGGGGGGPIDS